MGLLEEIYHDVKKTGKGFAKFVFFSVLIGLFLISCIGRFFLGAIGKVLDKIGLGPVVDGIANAIDWILYTLLFPNFDKRLLAPLSDKSLSAMGEYIAAIIVSAIICVIISFKVCRTWKGFVILYLILIILALIFWGHILDPAGTAGIHPVQP